MKRAWLVVLVLAASCFVQGALGQEPTFHEKVVHKVLEMLQVPTPTQITIDLHSQDELQDWFKSEQMAACMRGSSPLDTNRRRACLKMVNSIQFFAFGRWVEEDDEGHLHIVLYQHAGIDTLVHETLHWVMHNRTNPKGILNNHALVDPMVGSLLTSEEFVSWLEDNE